ncbi:hypothetical protein LA080_012147 [Diaporthe eres]|nr:hypothetical protein LA080_012147 [Diaporthe eres]
MTTEDPAATANPAELPPPSPAPVDARPMAPIHVAVELADTFSHTSSFIMIKTGCEFYGIHMHESQFITRARLSLHIVGVTSESVGTKKWEELAERLASFISACHIANTVTIGHWNKHGPILFPNAWIPCISPVEALRQCIMRLLDEYEIPIPIDSLDLRGMEPPRVPSFNLHGCFEHLLSEKEGKPTRFLYIEKALSCWGVYPKDSLFQEMATVLGNILTVPVIAQGPSPWNKDRVLHALGMGTFEIKKDRQGRSTRKFILQPWGIELGPTYDIDFFISMWIGHAITSDFLNGQTRMEGPSEAGREIAPSSSAEEGGSGHDGEDEIGRSSDGVMEQAEPSASLPLASAHEHVHRGRPADPEVGPLDAMPITTPQATLSKSPGKCLTSPSPAFEDDQHKRAKSYTTAMDIDQVVDDGAGFEHSEHHDEE